MPDRTTLEFEGVDRAVPAAAIHRYVRHPAARHAIGTEAEQARLRAEPGHIRYGVLPLPEPLARLGLRRLRRAWSGRQGLHDRRRPAN